MNHIINRISLLTLLVIPEILTAQDLINPYNYQSYFTESSIPSYNAPINGKTFTFDFPRQFNYDGEYVIYIGLLPYFNSLNNPALTMFSPLFHNYNPNLFFKSYVIEAISFPFSMECAFNSPIGCADYSTIRSLNMPPETSYDDDVDITSWIYNSCHGPECRLRNILKRPFRNDGYSSRFATSVDPAESQALISSAFLNNSSLTNYRDYLPHTVLKHTIRFHCGPDISAPIISELSFIYDNTRGLMRYYPFYPTNNPLGHGHRLFYDILLIPKIFQCNSFGQYNSTNNCDCFGEVGTSNYCNNVGVQNVNGGTLDYFPFTEIRRGCTYQNFSDITDESDHFTDDLNTYWNIHPSPYSLLSSVFARSNDGAYFAGMDLNQGLLTRLSHNNQFSEAHTYFINNNIDLTKVNSEERKIYNPSEVSITARDLKFPANYIFLTTRGTYAYQDEYINQVMDPLNDFTFFGNDPRNYPVVTDLRYDGSDPAYISHSNDPNYASIYKLENGSKLTIEPCVHIYDCTFDVKPGSEIVFENWSTNQHNIERYNVLPSGGIITKRNSGYLFQDEQEDRYILRYESGDAIRAGHHVDPQRASGNYELLSGSEVHFKATSHIDLESGFTVEPGAVFTASIENIIIPSCPLLRKRNTKIENESIIQKNIFHKFLQVSPNPANEEVTFYFSVEDENKITIQIFNMHGQLISTAADQKWLKAGNYSYTYKSESLRSGMYLVLLSTGNNTQSVKFVKQ